MSAILAENIFKTYGKRKEIKALADVSFDVQQGELFGIIGSDGAGKTSLFRILTTLLLADSGKASVEGLDVVKDYKAIRKTVGYMPGRFSLYPDLTVEENLNFFATVFSTTVRQNYDLIKDIYGQIEPFKKRKAGELSGGMKQKLALSCALIHRPTVLFLDEPTTGVDAVSRKEFWEMLKNLKMLGITILVSTPYMDEAGLCDKIALIQNGKILSINTPRGIVHKFQKSLFAVRSSHMLILLNTLKEFYEVDDVYPFGQYHHVVMKKGSSEEKLHSFLTQKMKNDFELKAATPGIEDCFIDLMKEN
ncbi:MAG: ABC transporter ATP-binding protein [Bacteroidetes bacterium]|nr:ABC transporter ATP-binding protein [Bacteroidota bacterium]MBS1930241.1 ABC transporter ATP-binding protein [Bacteroidota bacterium]